MRTSLRFLSATLGASALASVVLPAQPGGTMTPEQQERRWELERELQSLATVQR